MTEQNLPVKSSEAPSVEDVTAAVIPSFSNYRITKDGIILSQRRERAKGGLVKQYLGNHGYLFVHLYKNKKQRNRLVHRLILETYIGPCPKGMESCHADGNRLNNCLENLRWDTRSNNREDSRRHGTLTIGEKNPTAILTEDEVKLIFRAYHDGAYEIRELAEIFNRPYGTIYYIVKKLRWGYLWE